MANTHPPITDARVWSTFGGARTTTLGVLRDDPRNTRIIRAVIPAAITLSWITPSTDASTNFEPQVDLQFLRGACPESRPEDDMIRAFSVVGW